MENRKKTTSFVAFGQSREGVRQVLGGPRVDLALVSLAPRSDHLAREANEVRVNQTTMKTLLPRRRMRAVLNLCVLLALVGADRILVPYRKNPMQRAQHL